MAHVAATENIVPECQHMVGPICQKTAATVHTKMGSGTKKRAKGNGRPPLSLHI
jgi:hypothetical protein